MAYKSFTLSMLSLLSLASLLQVLTFFPLQTHLGRIAPDLARCAVAGPAPDELRREPTVDLH